MFNNRFGVYIHEFHSLIEIVIDIFRKHIPPEWISIILPTLNEEKNLKILVPHLVLYLI